MHSINCVNQVKRRSDGCLCVWNNFTAKQIRETEKKREVCCKIGKQWQVDASKRIYPKHIDKRRKEESKRVENKQKGKHEFESSSLLLLWMWWAHFTIFYAPTHRRPKISTRCDCFETEFTIFGRVCCAHTKMRRKSYVMTHGWVCAINTVHMAALIATQFRCSVIVYAESTWRGSNCCLFVCKNYN